MFSILVVVNDALRPGSRLPAMASSMPETLTLLHEEWTTRGLESFRNFKFPKTDLPLNLAYSKRKYLFDAIKLKAHSDGSTLEESAFTLDGDRMRKRMSVTQYLKDLKANDNKIVRRAKRPRPPLSPSRRVRAPTAAPPTRADIPGAARARAGRAAIARNAAILRAQQAQQRQYDRNWRSRLTPMQVRDMAESDRMMTPFRPTTWENNNRTSGNRFGQDNEY
jgi:hypothetical protein